MDVDLTMPGPSALAAADRMARRLGAPDARFLLGVRAGHMGLRSHGRVSAGGSCRLLAAEDGWLAVNLARASDVEAVGAVVGRSLDGRDPWTALEAHSQTATAGDVVERCQLLGVPAAVLDDPAVRASEAVTTHQIGEPSAPGARTVRPRVVDLSSMWAGPLCAHLLGRNGMDILKVESRQRPDGARFGDPAFFGWLHDGHAELALDFDSAAGRGRLAELVAGADVVIEASRPRALRQLGVDPADLPGRRQGQVWISITGYGRRGARDNWLAFGDDAAVAGGLVARDDAGPAFVADAVADPLTGLVAADAALAAWTSGGGVLVEVRMAAVARMFAEMA